MTDSDNSADSHPVDRFDSENFADFVHLDNMDSASGNSYFEGLYNNFAAGKTEGFVELNCWGMGFVWGAVCRNTHNSLHYCHFENHNGGKLSWNTS